MVVIMSNYEAPNPLYRGLLPTLYYSRLFGAPAISLLHDRPKYKFISYPTIYTTCFILATLTWILYSVFKTGKKHTKMDALFHCL